MRDPYKAAVNEIIGENADDPEGWEAYQRVKAEADRDPLKRAHQIMVLVINSTGDEKEINKQARRWLADFKDTVFPDVAAAIARDRHEQLMKNRFWPKPGDKADYRGFDMICQQDGTMKVTTTTAPSSIASYPIGIQQAIMREISGKTYSTFDTACSKIDKVIRDLLNPIKRRRRK